MLSVTVIYDILRDGIGATPIVLVSLWLVGAVVGLWMIVRLRRRPGGPSRLAVAVSLLWLAVGGFGFGNVLYQHLRCRAAAASGDVQVVQGAVTAYRPEDPHMREYQETLTVAGQTWTYSSSDLGRGGYRGVPPAAKRIGVGTWVRISSYDGRILKLELLEDRPSPAG
jgi:hypothetical protein